MSITPLSHRRSGFKWRIASSLLSALALYGCGGGGGSGQDLTVNFSYGSSAQPLFAPTNSVPLIDGLNGNSPRCAVGSGALPPGISVSANCALTGVPTTVGTYTAVISLTVDGFKGSVSSPVTIQVLAPTLAAIGVPTPSDGQSVAIGVQLDHFAIVTIGTADTASHPTFVPQAGDTLLFQITSGGAPQGLTLDPTTGTLNGIATGFGPSSMSITLTMSHGATSFTTQPVTVKTTAVEAPWTLTYANCCIANQGDSIAVAPTSTFEPVAGSTSTFQWFGTPPAGVTLDTGTGAIGGWIGTSGQTTAAVTQTVTFPDRSVQSATSATIVWNVTGPSFNYVLFNFTTFDGHPFSFSPTPISGGLPGDTYVFSLTPTPGFGALPAWLNIDPSTGVVYGVGGTPTHFADSADVTVVLTTSRGGHSFTSTARMDISIQP